MTAEEAEKTLYYAAVSRAVGLGFRLGFGADPHFRDMARQTAQEIFVAGRSEEDTDTDLERAVRSFQTMVDTMISVRRIAYADDPLALASNVIGERTLGLARLRLCPGFWPFC
jgi:hypothetical protein